MGYPVPAYRQSSVARLSGMAGSQKPSGGNVLHFPRARSEFRTWGQQVVNSAYENSSRAAPVVGSMSPNEEQWFRRKTHRGLSRERRSYRPFGLAQRQANQRFALGAVRGGLKFRSMLFRALMNYALENGQGLSRHLGLTRNPGTAKHPGWLISGRWGLYPFCSGQTSAHTNGQFVGHNFPPTSFNHPWGGAPFDWAEYDSVTQIVNPITQAISYHFLQVGRGDRGTGPNPNTFYGGLQRPIEFANPWAPQYNPWWNRFNWPNPLPRINPWPHLSPMIDPFSTPAGEPGTGLAPAPIPFPLIPGMTPNGNRSPSERTQRGPRPDPTVNPNPEPDVTPKPTGDPAPWKPPTFVEKKGRWTTTTMGGEKRAPMHEDKPPGRGTRERKHQLKGANSTMIMKWINQFTEYADWIAALHKTLHPKYRSKGKFGLNDKFKDLYNNFDKLNLEDAAMALIANEIQDFLFGQLGQFQGRVASRNQMGFRIDKAGRTMRKLDTGVREGLNALVADIMREVFNYDGPRFREPYNPYWLHHGRT